MGAVALRHQRPIELLTVNGTANLHNAPGSKQLRNVVQHDARPRTWVDPLLEPSIKLSYHASIMTTRNVLWEQ